MRSIVLWLAIAAAVPVQLAAQLTVGAYTDTLATIGDVVLLRRMRTALPVTGADADATLRRGLIELRIHELTRDVEDVRHARDVFEHAAERFPLDARVQHGLALANLASPGAAIASPGGVLDGVTVAASIEEILKRDPRSRARGALKAALRADPSYGVAAALLADLAVRDGRDRGALEEAREALRAARAGGSTAAEVARALSDVERALGNYAAAAEEADRSLDAGDGDLAASALHARAVALFMQPGREREGAAAYERGAERLTESAAERYYEDVAPIASVAEAAEWRAAGLREKRVWLERFWGRRAAESGVTPAERMAEHYRRLAFARERYLRNSMRGVDGEGVLLAAAPFRGGPYDDRGVILLRHGPPAEVVRTAGRGLQPNETWVYGGEDGNLLFHFVALRGARDFTLVGDLFDALDYSLPLRGVEHTRAVLALVADVGAYDPEYASAANRLRRPLELGESLDGTEVRSITERVFAEYRRNARRALERDSYSPGYARDIAFHYDLFTFRSPAGRTELTAAFAVPRAALTEAADGFPARISVILLDTLTGTTTRRDTVALLRPGSERGGDGYLRTHVTFPVDPSSDVVHRVVVRDTAGEAGALRRGTSVLRSYAGEGLRISDIVLAEPDSAGAWRRGDLRLTFALPRTFGADRPFTVYYEVYGLAPDAAYRTELRVEPVDRSGLLDRVRALFGGGAGGVDLRFDDVAAPRDDIVAETRRLGTDLPPGRYSLTITVTDRTTGEAAVTAIRFEVVE